MVVDGMVFLSRRASSNSTPKVVGCYIYIYLNNKYFNNISTIKIGVERVNQELLLVP